MCLCFDCFGFCGFGFYCFGFCGFGLCLVSMVIFVVVIYGYVLVFRLFFDEFYVVENVSWVDVFVDDYFLVVLISDDVFYIF